jgi:hypothetical protein
MPAHEQILTRTRIEELINGQMTQNDLEARRLTKEGREITVILTASALGNYDGEALLIVLTEHLSI